jgi:hypothetical protein
MTNGLGSEYQQSQENFPNLRKVKAGFVAQQASYSMGTDVLSRGEAAEA